MKKQYHKHDRALKKVTTLKNNARRVFYRAKREELPPNEILSLAKKFFELVRQHSSLKKRSQKKSQDNAAKKARQRCYKTFGSLQKICWMMMKLVRLHQNSQRMLPMISSPLLICRTQ